VIVRGPVSTLGFPDLGKLNFPVMSHPFFPPQEFPFRPNEFFPEASRQEPPARIPPLSLVVPLFFPFSTRCNRNS